jgi:hypothetical protein
MSIMNRESSPALERSPLGVEPELRKCAAEKVTCEELPSPDRLSGIAHPGSGEKCSLCALEIAKYRDQKSVFEYDVQWKRGERTVLLRFHSDCFRAWISLAAIDVANPDCGMRDV